MQSQERPYDLPGWLDALLPDLRSPNVLEVVHGPGDEDCSFVMRSPDGSERDLGIDLERAYDEADANGDLAFSDALVSRWGRWGRHMITLLSEHGFRVLMSRTDYDRLRSLQDAWHRAQETDAAWRDDPADFMASYAWLDTHPAFWTREPQVTADSDQSAAWSWQTAGYMDSGLSMLPFRDEDSGHVLFAMEAGAHVADEERWEDGRRFLLTGVHKTHYHDMRLDVAELSYELATVALAHKVDTFFSPDGSERPDVPWTKSTLALEIERRMAEMVADRPRDDNPPRRPFLTF